LRDFEAERLGGLEIDNQFESGWPLHRQVARPVAEGRKEQFPLYLEEFVRLKVDVIVTHPDETILIAKQMTSTIPIIFPLTRDPVELGVVPSLARPSGNATGLSIQRGDTVGKRVEMLRETSQRSVDWGSCTILIGLER
jgi:putative ABC transport system substrate-binding protein